MTAVLAIGYNLMCVGKQVVPVDTENAQVCPVAVNNRTLVPVSRIVAAFDGESGWDAKTNNTTYSLGNRTYVPVRYVLEGLGLWVGYEPTYQLVIVSTQDLSGEDLIKLPETQRLFASETVPETPRKISERYTIDGENYIMEVGEALTLYNSRTAISGYSAYTWDVLEGGELVKVDRDSATCRFYAKRPGLVTIQSHMDEMIVNYFGGSTHNEVTYTMTITILPATEEGSPGRLMEYQPCPSCGGNGKIQVGTRQETCPTCLGRKFILQ